ncbi:MAG TPA: hypothetical protein VJ785_08140, partial [Anaerolineales bacterium]|nr:hypothetical protein [Anaerolineales bacterium]
QLVDAMLAGAMGAEVKLPIPDLHAVPDDHASAVSTFGSQCMDRALETVEHVGFAPQYHFKRLIILVSTDFTLCHRSSFLS